MSGTNDVIRSRFDKLSANGVFSSVRRDEVSANGVSIPFVLSEARAKSKGEHGKTL
jgi:hypothetical protein